MEGSGEGDEKGQKPGVKSKKGKKWVNAATFSRNGDKVASNDGEVNVKNAGAAGSESGGKSGLTSDNNKAGSQSDAKTGASKDGSRAESRDGVRTDNKDGSKVEPNKDSGRSGSNEASMRNGDGKKAPLADAGRSGGHTGPKDGASKVGPSGGGGSKAVQKDGGKKPDQGAKTSNVKTKESERAPSPVPVIDEELDSKRLQLKAEILELLLSRANDGYRIPDTLFCIAYNQKFRKELNLKEFGASHLYELFGMFGDIISFKRDADPQKSTLWVMLGDMYKDRGMSGKKRTAPAARPAKVPPKRVGPPDLKPKEPPAKNQKPPGAIPKTQSQAPGPNSARPPGAVPKKQSQAPGPLTGKPQVVQGPADSPGSPSCPEILSKAGEAEGQILDKEKLMEELFNLLQLYKHGMPESYIHTAYSRMYKKTLAPQRYGLKDMDAVLEEFNFFHLSTVENSGEVWLDLEETYKIHEIKPAELGFDVDLAGLERLKRELIKVLKAVYPGSIRWSDVPAKYRKTFKQRINVKKYGTVDMDDLILLFLDIFESKPTSNLAYFVARLHQQYVKKTEPKKMAAAAKKPEETVAAKQPTETVQEVEVVAKPDDKVLSGDPCLVPPSSGPDQPRHTLNDQESERAQYLERVRKQVQVYDTQIAMLQNQYLQRMQQTQMLLSQKLLDQRQYATYKHETELFFLSAIAQIDSQKKRYIQQNPTEERQNAGAAVGGGLLPVPAQPAQPAQSAPGKAAALPTTEASGGGGLLPTPSQPAQPAPLMSTNVSRPPQPAADKPATLTTPQAAKDNPVPVSRTQASRTETKPSWQSKKEDGKSAVAPKQGNLNEEEWPDLFAKVQGKNSQKKSLPKATAQGDQSKMKGSEVTLTMQGLVGGRKNAVSKGQEKSTSSLVRTNPDAARSTPPPPPVSVEKYSYKGGKPNKEYVNAVCDDIITKLAENGEYVTVEKVLRLVFQHFNVSSLRELNYRNEKQVDRLFELHQLQCKVSAYIQAFLMVRSISTAHELVQSLSDIDRTKKSYAELNLGPIARNPIVNDMFKLPPTLPDADIPPVTTMDIMRHLRVFMKKFDCWRSPIDLTKFMEYLMGEYNCDEPYQLGVRIQSIALAVSVIKKAQRDEKTTFDMIRVQVVRDMEEEIDAKLQKLKSTLLDSFGDPSAAVATPGYDLRKKYASLTAAEVIMDVFMAFKQISIDRSLQRHMEKFFDVVMMNPLARQLFQLAICTGKLEEPEGFFTFESAPHGSASRDAPAAEIVDDSKVQQLTPPSAAMLLQQLVKYLEKCQGSLSLTILSRIEKKLADHFKFETFLAMGYGTFLEYINSHPQMLEEYGGSQLGIGSSGSVMSGSVYRPNRQDVLEFIQQCGALDKGDLIESALCSHFKVSSARELGHGSLLQLVNTVKKQQKSAGDVTAAGLHSRVIYESAFSTSNRSTEVLASGEQRKVGLLGAQQKVRAMACLMNAPLLEDLAAWSHWSLVFEPEHGDLKHFIEKNAGSIISDITTGVQFPFDVSVLEPKPGVLLKLTTTTSPAVFAKHAGKGDARQTAGHLVSIVIQYGGFKNSPLALLANMMESALAQLCVSSSPPGAPQPTSYEDDYELSNYGAVLEFVIKLLVYIPTQICVAIANQVIIEPLGRAVGATKSKTLLAKYCKSSTERSRLQELGLMLGINEWVVSFSERTVIQAPVSCVEREDVVNVETPVESRVKSPSGKDDPYYDPDVYGEIEEDSDTSSDSGSDTDSDTESESSETESSDVEDLLRPESGSESAVDNTGDKASSDGAVAEVKVAEVKVDEVKGESNDELEIDAREGTDGVKDETGEVKGEGEEDIEKDEVVEDEKEEVEEEKKLTEEEMREMECRRVIDEIRQYEFGIGIELTQEATNLMERLQNRTGRSLERLSTELYSKDTHFVLELVQNADDNSYGEEEDGPALKFVVEKACVTVLNNESGFREKDIRALCDVGKSTKGKHKYGYIGQKGIGFKSVFRVTDKPSIHSNGYHMCFDAKSGPVGYILPHWIGNDDDDSVSDAANISWKTTIVLPLKSEIQHSRSLGNRFHDIHPSLLLFLHRLKSITIEDKVSGEIRCMKRTDGSHGVIEIQHGDGVDRWLVVKKQLDATKMVKENVESTELALAFLLQPNSQDGGTMYPQSAPSKEKVFAFLPLRSYGFRFVIQGDFDVPSSREDVDNDSAWNQWLRGELPLLFIQALQAFKDHPALSDLEAVCNFLQYVPMEGEILGFFKPVAKQIIQQLKASPCLPTDVKAGEGAFEWKLPSELAVTRDPLLKEVISSDLLHHHLNRSYLHPSIVSAISLPLINMLGVQTLSVKHLIEIGKAVAASRQESSLTVSFVAKWLACLHRLMESDYTIHEDDVIKEVKTIPVVPLSNGRYVALDDCSVFFPVTGGRQTDLGAVPKNKAKGQGRLMALEKDLNSVPAELLTCLDEVCNSQVRSVLNLLGVCEMQPREVIKNHIMPVFKSDRWKDKDDTLLMEFVIYIKEESEKLPSVCDMEELKGIVRVITNHGLVNPSTQPTHFTTEYGNKVDLQRQLPGYDWILLDSRYLQYNKQQQNVSSWQTFFSKLGVLHSLAVKKEMVTIPENEIIHSPWAHNSIYKFWPRPEDGNYRIEDWVCDEFHGLVTAGNISEQQKVAQSQVLMKILEDDWDGSYSKYTNASVCGKDGNILANTQSSFGIYATTLPWLPAIHRHPSGVLETPTYLTGREVYLHSDKVFSLLADHVYYLMGSVGNVAMTQHLQIKTAGHINVEVVLEHLHRWCTGHSATKEGEPTKTGVQFQTSQHHITSVYGYLEQEAAPSVIQKFFESYPAVFVPEGQGSVGRFYHKSDVYWHDPSNLFVKYASSATSSHIQVPQRPQLAHFYGDLPGFFCGAAVSIEEKPKMTDYIALLLRVVDITMLPDYERLQDVYHLFAVLGEKCLVRDPDHQGGYPPHQPEALHISPIYGKHLRGMIEKEKIFPTKSNQWVSLEDGLFVSDDKHLEKLFKEKSVNLLDLGESKMSTRMVNRGQYSRQRVDTKKYDENHLKVFLDACEVPHFSRCIEPEYITESFQPCPPLQNFFHEIVPYIQLFLYNKYAEDVYGKLAGRNMAGLLQITQFGQVGKLQVVYRMAGDESMYAVENVVCALVDQRQFYVDKDYVETIRTYPVVRDEICRMFSEGNAECQRDLKNFLRALLPFLDGLTGESREEFLESQDFEGLSENEEKWEVKEARPPTPPPPPPPPPEPVIVITDPTQEASAADENETGDEKVAKAGLNDDGTPVLPCWPPKAGGYSSPSKGGKSRLDEAAEVSMKIWPPPAPLEEPSSESETSAVRNERPRADRGGVQREGGEQRESTTDIPAKHGRSEENRHPNKEHSSHEPEGKRHAGPSNHEGWTEAPRQKEASNHEEVSRDDSQPHHQGEEVQTENGRLPGDENHHDAHPGKENEDHDGKRKKRSGARKFFNFTEPTWKTQDLDEALEELGAGDVLMKRLPADAVVDVSDDLTEIGKWGEALVYNFLLHQKESMDSENMSVDVVWVNEEEESGQPYDLEIKVRQTDGDDDDGDVAREYSIYVEVKSTKTKQKKYFEISSQEISFAEKMQDQFHLYRVYNAGQADSVRLCRVQNLAEKLDTKTVRLCMFV